MAEKKDKMKASRCLKDATNLPPRVFALPDDGRKASHLQQQRKALTQVLAFAANADGSSIRISQQTMKEKTGFSQAKVNRLLDDLKTLGILTDEGYFKVAEHRFVSIRALHLPDTFEAAVERVRDTFDPNRLVSDSSAPLVSDSPTLVSDSPTLVSDSQFECETSREYETQPPLTLTAYKPPTHTEKKSVCVNSFSQAAKWLQTDMLTSQWKRGEREAIDKIISDHGGEMFLAVELLYWEEQDTDQFAKTLYKWTALIIGFDGLVHKVKPEFLEELAAARWKAENPEQWQRQMDASIARQTAEIVKRRDAEPPRNEASIEDFFGAVTLS
jgi:hypothetical protein